MSTVRGRMRKLSSQIFVTQLAILTVTVAVGFGLFARAERGRLESHYESRAASIAETVAGVPAIRSCMAHDRPGCAATIQSFATETQHQTGASYVVVIDMDRVRHSHPNPDEVGKRVAEPIVTRDGKVHLRTDNGSTGASANARVPLYGPDGQMVGEVSVGLPESSVWSALLNELPSFAVWFAVALAVGAIASWALARRLKRRTFDLELDEFADLVHEREATLHGIREGVLAIDRRGVLTLMNEQAHQLLGTSPGDVGRRAAEALHDSDVVRLLPAESGDGDVTDLVTVHRGRLLMGSRRRVPGLGHVITLRDRTELDHALRELDETRSLTDALRAQQHEFSNRMHVLAGLLDLGRVEEAAGYARELDGSSATGFEAQISDTRIVALLLAKASVAREHAVTLDVRCDRPVRIDDEYGDALVSIVGNLVDNAIEALPPGGQVGVTFGDDGAALVIDVVDDGPGIPAGAEEAIFTGGWSTKDANGRPRGIGLALVRQLVLRMGGTIEVLPGDGAHFRVTLPRVRVPS